jgi:hypothetical protein
MPKLMKKYFIISVLILISLAGLVFWRVEKSIAPAFINNQIQPFAIPAQNDSLISEPVASSIQRVGDWQAPLDRAKERVIKKYFGILIDPETSPVQPERFRGYHTGVDFEIFSEELNAEVDVHAICDGRLILKKTASGYGGVAVQSCALDNNPVTVVYGHLKLASITKNSEADLKVGDVIGQLGVAHSTETDGERKHLHLGIHSGTAVNILGYVQTKSALSDWVDPCLYTCE